VTRTVSRSYIYRKAQVDWIENQASQMEATEKDVLEGMEARRLSKQSFNQCSNASVTEQRRFDKMVDFMQSFSGLPTSSSVGRFRRPRTALRRPQTGVVGESNASLFTAHTPMLKGSIGPQQAHLSTAITISQSGTTKPRLFSGTTTNIYLH